MNRHISARHLVRSIVFICCLVPMSAGLTCPGDDGVAPLEPPVTGGNTPPRIVITNVATPSGDDLAEQGDPVTISFTGEDAEDVAIARVFVSTSPNPTPPQEIPVLSGFPIGPGVGSGSAILDTAGVVTGSYHIFAEIDDRTFDPNTDVGNAAVRVTYITTILITPVGTAPENGSPTIIPRLPNIDTGVSNEDILLVRFDVSDPNSDLDSLALTVFFDRDLNPSNDASQPPVQVDTFVIPSGTPPNQPILSERQIVIDLNQIPVRKETDESGRPLPYFVRIRADDGEGGTVQAYAAGAVRVLAAGSGVVDLLAVGGRTAGATWQGFAGVPTDPRFGDHAGSGFAPLGDMDNDGLDDFAIIAETASPFGNTSVGEVYTIYGRSRQIDPDLPNSAFFQGRFSGVLSLNTVGTWVAFPPSDPRFRDFFVIRGHALPHTHEGGGLTPGLGITSVVSMPDVTVDLRPDVIAGAPYSENILDEEDLDPCDTCTFPANEVAPFVCFTDVDVLAGDEALSGDATGILQPLTGGEWSPVDPDGQGNSFPSNVDIELDPQRIRSILAFRVIVSGSIPNTMAPGSINIEVQLESACGPLRVITANFDDQGQFDETIVDFLNEINNTNPQYPIVQHDDALPPSVYDGRFAIFLRPSQTVELDAITVEVDAVVASPEAHLIKFSYLDGMPSPISTLPGCSATLPEPVNPFALNFLVSSAFGGPTFPPRNRVFEPYDTVISGSLSLLIPGLPNGLAQLYRLYVDGHLCDSVDPLFDSFGDGLVEDDGFGLYQSGTVYMASSDELVTTLSATGEWMGDGCPVQPLGQFGQEYGGCLNDALKGARFRGAWYNPTSIGDGVGGGFVGPYDPTSLFGYTVDVMPDLNGIFSPSSELLISAPGGGSVLARSVDVTAGLGGDYTAVSLTCRTTTFNVGQTFSQVVAAGLTIRGSSRNLARLRLSLNRNCGDFLDGADTTLLLWPGASNPGDQPPGELEYGQFFGDQIPNTQLCEDHVFNFAFAGLQLKLPVVPELQFAFVPLGADIAQVLATGEGTLTLEILPDATIKDSSAQLISAEFIIAGSVPGSGYVWILEGQDYSANNSITALCNSAMISTGGDQEGGEARPMSWPSTGCDTLPDPNIREFCYPQPVAFMQGETITDGFGWARHAGDPNQDSNPDIACGSPLASSSPTTPDLFNCPPLGEPAPLFRNGKTFLIYGTPTFQNGLPCAYNRLEIRGSHADDQFGRVQAFAGDMNADNRDDMYFAAENYDALGSMAGVQNRGADAGFVGVIFGGSPGLTGEIAIRPEQVGTGNFLGCRFVGGAAGARLGGCEPAKASTRFYPIPPNPIDLTASMLTPIIDRGQHGVSSAGDFNLDNIDDLLITAPGQMWPGATLEFVGNVADGNLVTISGRVFEFDTNGSVGAGRTRVALTSSSPSVAQAALLAELETAGNEESFNLAALSSRLEFPDPLPDTPTISFLARTPLGFAASSNTGSIDVTTTTRKGVAYLVFGSPTLLTNKTFYLPEDLNRRVGPNRILKGIVFVSAYEENTAAENDGVFSASETPDEAPVQAVSRVGDVDGDGFPDIILGSPQADFINILSPNQRRQAAGEAYLIYGNDFGLNEASEP